MDDKLSPLMTGFRKNYNTQQALLNMSVSWKRQLDKGSKVGAIIMDLSKALDTSNHHLLITKFDAYNFDIPSMKLIKNYLSNRKQRCKVNNSYSTWKDLIAGVPQGSILGPLLFIIYINDLYKASSLMMEVMFADDTNLFLSHKNINDLFLNMNNELQNISTWFKANKLSLNLDKTKWSLFHPLHKKDNIPLS